MRRADDLAPFHESWNGAGGGGAGRPGEPPCTLRLKTEVAGHQPGAFSGPTTQEESDMAANIVCGIGAERDSQLLGGRRGFSRTFNEGIPRERAVFPLGLSAAVQHSDVVQGDLVSINKDGRIVPLDPGLAFGGLIEKIGENHLGKYEAGVIVRAALCVKVQGLSPETKRGAKIYATPGPRQTFTLEEAGGVLVGELCAVENMERSMANVGIRLEGDSRRFELGGPLASR